MTSKIVRININNNELSIDKSKRTFTDITNECQTSSDTWWQKYSYTATEDCTILVDGHGSSKGFYVCMSVKDSDNNVINCITTSDTNNAHSFGHSIEVYKGTTFWLEYTKSPGFSLSKITKITFN